MYTGTDDDISEVVSSLQTAGDDCMHGSVVMDNAYS